MTVQQCPRVQATARVADGVGPISISNWDCAFLARSNTATKRDGGLNRYIPKNKWASPGLFYDWSEQHNTESCTKQIVVGHSQ